MNMPEARMPPGCLQRTGLSAGFLVLWLGMFSCIVTGSVGHDENMYIAAGILSQSQSLYTDFAYLQMPYLPMLYGTIYKLTGTAHFLLWGRLISFVFMVISSLLVYFISRKISGSRLVAVCMVVLASFNGVLIRTSGYSWNSVMPIPLALGAFYLFVLGIADKVRPLLILFSGILISMAIGTKLLYAVMAPAFVVTVFLYPEVIPFRQRIVRGVVPLVSGMIAGIIPVLIYLFRDFDGFIFNNLQYHRLNTLSYQLQGDTNTMSLGSKVYYARDILSDPSNISLIICLLFLVFTVIRTIHTRRKEPNDATPEGPEILPHPFRERVGGKGPILLASLLVLFSTALLLITTPLQNQYFAIPIPFVVLLIVCLYSGIREEAKIYVRILFVAVALMSAFLTWPRLFRYRDGICYTSRWTAISVHNTAQQIRQAVGPLRDEEVVATLSPLYVMEAGLPILPELATGPFMFRVGDLIPAEKRRRYVATGASDIGRLFDKTKPKAILVGYEPDLDAPLIEYARKHGYNRIEKDFQGGTLYVKRAENIEHPTLNIKP